MKTIQKMIRALIVGGLITLIGVTIVSLNADDISDESDIQANYDYDEPKEETSTEEPAEGVLPSDDDDITALDTPASMEESTEEPTELDE